nr:gamma-glutamylcyclotransferase family protein [Mucilaginibacter straminoryzae]
MFVYGTLLKDFKHQVLDTIKHCLELVEEVSIKGTLFDLGSYPGFVQEGEGEVKGELYRINDPQKVFEVLDEYEGLNEDQPEYVRKEIAVTLNDGSELQSWIYEFQPGDGQQYKIIENGDYIAYIRNKVKNVS